MFKDNLLIPRLALPRSAMFAAMKYPRFAISLPWSEEHLLDLPFYKH